MLGIGRATRPDAFFGAQGPMVRLWRRRRRRSSKWRAPRSNVASKTASALKPGAEILRASGPAGACCAAGKSRKLWSRSGPAWRRRRAKSSRPPAPLRRTSASPARGKTRRGSKISPSPRFSAGGAEMHRLGLSETILVFPEHLAFCRRRNTGQRHGAPATRRAGEKAGAGSAHDRGSARRGGSGIRRDSGGEIFARRRSPNSSVKQLATLARRPIHRRRWRRQARKCRRIAPAGADILVTSAPYAAAPRDVSVRISCL